MAILWADGFDDWTIASGVAGEYELFSAGSMQMSSTLGRRGTGALRIVSFSDYLHKTLPATYPELFACVAFNPAAMPNAGTYSNVLSFYSATTAMVSIRVNADGSISACRGTLTDTVLGTSAAGLVTSGVYTHFQIRVVFSSTVGVVQVRLNGATINALSLTAQNTGGATANGLRVYSGSSSVTPLYDDLVVSDTSGSIANSWPGDVRVDSYLPNGNGDLSQMTGADGDSINNYLQVQTAAPNATNYTQSATVGHEDLYAMADMTHNPVAILGAVCTASALKDDAGARSIRLHAKSGGTDSASAADIALGTSRARVHTVFETDPSTGVAWTKAGLNAAQFGFAVTV